MNGERQGGGRTRRRLRGMMETKTGKAVGIVSLAAPVVGFIIKDLKKPNSITRQLVGKAVKKLLERKPKQVEVIDITDRAEITDITDEDNLIQSK